jgi:glycerol-3-phosphate dehydrogenase
MTPNLQSLTESPYDIIVIGGGIFGACAAWDAASRGLRVALLEKGDFSEATSANHLKMIHGGIRYMQHLDIPRVRESVRDRSALLRIAPHLSYPVPIAIPTYGHGIRGKEFLGAGFLLYDLLTSDRNRGIGNPKQQIPGARFQTRQEILEHFPGLNPVGLTGGAVFSDGQMYNPPRLALAFLKSAVDRGATVQNYIEVTRFLRKGNRVIGVEAIDTLGGEKVEVRGTITLNAAGPWAHGLLTAGLGLHLEPKPVFSRDLGFLIRRSLTGSLGLACQMRSRDEDAILSRGGRHVFMVPWHGFTLVGCWHVVYEDSPDEITVDESVLSACLAEINDYYPDFALKLDDIAMVHTGLTLFAENESPSGDLSFGKRSLLVDHARVHGVDGLVTLVGVRATTAPGMAARAVDLVFQRMARSPSTSRIAWTPIHGGAIADFHSFMEKAIQGRSPLIPENSVRSLVHNHGLNYQDVTRRCEEKSEWAETLGGSDVLKAEVVHAVRDEMARKLTDVVFRRTDLGTAGDPGEVAIRACAEVMRNEIGWTEDQTRDEIKQVGTIFRQHGRVKVYRHAPVSGSTSGNG